MHQPETEALLICGQMGLYSEMACHWQGSGQRELRSRRKLRAIQMKVIRRIPEARLFMTCELPVGVEKTGSRTMVSLCLSVTYANDKNNCKKLYLFILKDFVCHCVLCLIFGTQRTFAL